MIKIKPSEDVMGGPITKDTPTGTLLWFVSKYELKQPFELRPAILYGDDNRGIIMLMFNEMFSAPYLLKYSKYEDIPFVVFRQATKKDVIKITGEAE